MDSVGVEAIQPPRPQLAAASYVAVPFATKNTAVLGGIVGESAWLLAVAGGSFVLVAASAADYDERYDYGALAVVGDVAAACVEVAAAVVGWEAPLVAASEAAAYQLSRHQDGSSVLWETVPILTTSWNLSHDVDCLVSFRLAACLAGTTAKH